MAKKKKARLTRYDRLFGTPETATVTIHRLMNACGDLECPPRCPLDDICDKRDYKDLILDWLKGDDYDA